MSEWGQKNSKFMLTFSTSHAEVGFHAEVGLVDGSEKVQKCADVI